MGIYSSKICGIPLARVSDDICVFDEKGTSVFEVMKLCVFNYVLNHLDKSDKKNFTSDDVYIVWSCKTLQNWKALISTTLPDGMYYECTYNGDNKEMYLDAYKKFDNKTFKHESVRDFKERTLSKNKEIKDQMSYKMRNCAKAKVVI